MNMEEIEVVQHCVRAISEDKWLWNYRGHYFITLRWTWCGTPCVSAFWSDSEGWHSNHTAAWVEGEESFYGLAAKMLRNIEAGYGPE
jgi:hypothetical protein